jgi:hypothetical protein
MMVKVLFTNGLERPSLTAKGPSKRVPAALLVARVNMRVQKEILRGPAVGPGLRAPWIVMPTLWSTSKNEFGAAGWEIRPQRSARRGRGRRAVQSIISTFLGDVLWNGFRDAQLSGLPRWQ